MDNKEKDPTNPSKISRRDIIGKVLTFIGVAKLVTACAPNIEQPRGEVILNQDDFSKDIVVDNLTDQDKKLILEHRQIAYEMLEKYLNTDVQKYSPQVGSFNETDLEFYLSINKGLPNNQKLVYTGINASSGTIHNFIHVTTTFIGDRPISVTFSILPKEVSEQVPNIREKVNSFSKKDSQTVAETVINMLFLLPKKPEFKPALGERSGDQISGGNFYDGQKYFMKTDNKWEWMIVTIPIGEQIIGYQPQIEKLAVHLRDFIYQQKEALV